MSLFSTRLTWRRATSDFNYDTYDRTHTVQFPGGISYSGSAAPDFKGNPAHVNPEEALLAGLTSCHMLTFLAIAAKSGYVVDSYEDSSSAELGKNEAGKLALTKATLRPQIVFGGTKIPSAEELSRLHDKAHHNCFIANSITTKVTVESRA